jgi:hypothetical protein
MLLIFCSAFQNLRLGSIKLLQKIIASKKNQHIPEKPAHPRKTSTSLGKPTHHMLLLSFVIILQSLCSPNEDFGWPNERLGTHYEVLFKGVSTIVANKKSRTFSPRRENTNNWNKKRREK